MKKIEFIWKARTHNGITSMYTRGVGVLTYISSEVKHFRGDESAPAFRNTCFRYEDQVLNAIVYEKHNMEESLVIGDKITFDISTNDNGKSFFTFVFKEAALVSGYDQPSEHGSGNINNKHIEAESDAKSQHLADVNDEERVYITRANLNRHVLWKSKMNHLDLSGEIYKVAISYFNRLEKNQLLAVQELLENPKNYFDKIYVPFVPKDTYTLVYEEQQPAFHTSVECPMLQSDYKNYEIPNEIRDRGVQAVVEFREWFKTVEHLVDTQPDVFVFRLEQKYGIVTNVNAIDIKHTPARSISNQSYESIEKEIDNLLTEAGEFVSKSERNSNILNSFAKLAFKWSDPSPIIPNNTGYADLEVKDVLREFELSYKNPLKKMLIEYYQYKLNPTLGMAKSVMEALGFRLCGGCERELNGDFYGYQVFKGDDSVGSSED
jgi:hypothetical protein